MNPASYLSIYFNASDCAFDANNNAALRLRNAKEALGSIENKLQLTHHNVARSRKLIGYSKDHLKFEEEVIQRCLERLKSLDRSLKNYNEPEKGISKTDFSIEEKSESLNNLPKHQNLVAQDLPKYSEININSKPEVSFWCKKFNAARPELIEAMQKLNTKCWIELWKYFSGGGAHSKIINSTFYRNRQ